MRLYRGDNIFNKLTQPQIYRFDGLRTKAFGQGDPAYIKKNGLIDCIRKHVKPESNIDKDFYNKTDFISFTTDINRAMYWLSDQNKIVLEECLTDFHETRYLFEFSLQDSELVELEKGVYSFRYRCNPSLKTANSPSAIFSATLHLMYGVNQCPICNCTLPNHEIILIDTEVYLLEHAKEEKYNGAIAFSQADKEWLIWPSDPIDNTVFKFARIPRADFWSVKHYIGVGEQRPVTLDNG